MVTKTENSGFTLYILSAFSLAMLPAGDHDLQVSDIGDSNECARGLITLANNNTSGGRVVSAVGHKDTANLFSKLLNYPVEMNRVSITLDSPDWACLVGQLCGPRLPEGATELPEGASIRWMLVCAGAHKKK